MEVKEGGSWSAGASEAECLGLEHTQVRLGLGHTQTRLGLGHTQVGLGLELWMGLLEGLGDGGAVLGEPGVAGGELDGLEEGWLDPCCCGCVGVIP